MITRRALLAGSAAAACSACVQARPIPRANGDTALYALLDRLAALPNPQARSDALTGQTFVGLSHKAQLDLDVIKSGLAIDAEMARLMPFAEPGRGPYPVSPITGAWREPMHTDAAALIAEDTVRIRQAAAAGVVLPTGAIDKTIDGLRRVNSAAPPTVALALADQLALLEAQRKLATPPGLAALPSGLRYYRLAIARQFGDIDPAAMHARATAKARELMSAANEIMARIGYAGATTGERFKAAFSDPAFLYADSDEGRDRAVAGMNRRLDLSKSALPQLFGALPEECANVSVKRMSREDEAKRRGGYRVVPKADGTPGAYFVDLSDIQRRPSWSLASVVHHELLPGHMVHLPLEARAAPHPLRLQYASGFQEGWAIYAEELMLRRNAFDGEDRALLGTLHWLIFRAARSLIDTGVHFARCTLPEARQMLGEMLGEPAFFASFAQDIDRVMLDPGARAGEALAWLTLSDALSGLHSEQLRQRHHAILDQGRGRREQVLAQAHARSFGPD